MRTRLTRAAATLALVAAPARADVLLTTDGQILDGRPMERTEDGGVVVRFENGDITVPAELVQEVFLEADLEGLPRARRRQLEKQLEEKREQLLEAAAHSNWGNAYEDETKNFAWKYTIPEHIASEFKARFEAYHDLFAKRWKLKRDKRKPKMMVNFYRDSKQFQRVSGAPPGALAYFKFVEPYDLNACYDRIDPEEAEMVLYHELSHYLQKLIDEDFKMPHWPGEGISEYFGGALWDGKKLELGLIQAGRLNEVQQDISLEKYVSVKDIVTTAAYTDYTWGWALIHYLYQDSKLADGFDDYITGLARDKKVERVRGPFNLKTVDGEECLRYFMECLDLDDEEDLAQLEQAFYEYVKGLEQPDAYGLQKAAIAAKRVGKPLRAKRLFGEAEEAGGLSALGCYHYGLLLRGRGGDKAKARELFLRAAEQDPLVGTYWYRYAQLVEDEAEAERLKALAKELDPNVDSWLVEIEFADEDD